MKSTGIVRRMDDLGRIIIPKQICRLYGLSENSSLIVFAENNMVGMSKYDPSKDVGIVRKIDDLQRVIIPKEIRRFLGIVEGDPLEIYTDKEVIFFKKYVPLDQECVFCGELTNKYLFDKPVCAGCLDKIDQMYRR